MPLSGPEEAVARRALAAFDLPHDAELTPIRLFAYRMDTIRRCLALG